MTGLRHSRIFYSTFSCLSCISPNLYETGLRHSGIFCSTFSCLSCISRNLFLNLSYSSYSSSEYDELLTLVKKGKLRWFGHVSRSSGLAKTILQGTVKGKRKRGRQKKRWEDNITEWTGMDFASSTRAAENRSRWKGIVANSSVVPRRPSKVMG